MKAVAFGMGLGLGGDNLDYLKALLQEPITLIIDADGLNTLAQNLELLSDKKAGGSIQAGFQRPCPCAGRPPHLSADDR